MKKFLLVGLILLFVQYSLAATEPFVGDKSPASRLASQANSAAITISPEDEKPTTWQSYFLCRQRTLGAVFEVLGGSAAATGAVMLLTANEPVVSGILASGGLFVERLGSWLTSNADTRAAKFERLLNEQVRKITTPDLTPEQVDILSAAFYKDLGCEGEWNCAARFDRIVSVVCTLFGPPLGLSGLAVSKRYGGDNVTGICLSATGGVMYKLGSFFGLRAQKRDAQLQRMAAIEEAKKAT